MPKYANPLKEYMELSGLTFADIAKMSELPRQTIVDMSSLDEVGLSNLRIRTALHIKKYLNIDLFKYIERTYKVKRKV